MRGVTKADVIDSTKSAHSRGMTRALQCSVAFVTMLSACDQDSSPGEVDSFVDATAELAEALCDCDDDREPGECAEEVEEILDQEVRACIEDLVSTDAAARDGMRCTTSALRDLVGCYDAEGICPQAVASASTSPDGDVADDEPISDDDCGLAFESAIDACGELPAQSQDTLDDCLPGAHTEACDGGDC